MYSLQVLLVLASTLFFLRAWESRRLLDYGLYALTTILALYTQIGSIFLLAAQGVYVLAAGRKRIPEWLATQAIVILAFVPWIIRFMAHRSVGDIGTIGFERESGPLQLAYGIYTFSVGYSLGPSVSALHYLSPGKVLHEYLPILAATAIVFGALLIAGLVYARRDSHTGFWFVLSQAGIPLMLVLAASLLPGVGLTPRYLTVAIVPYWIILAVGIQRGKIVLQTLAILLVVLSLQNHYFRPEYAKQDVRSAVSVINEEAVPGDVIIISSIELGGPFNYYFERPEIEFFGYPCTPGTVDPSRLDRDLKRLTDGKKRAWLILGRTWSSDPNDEIRRYFDSRYRSLECKRANGVSTTCYSLR